MAKYKYGWDEAKIQRYIKKGRGQGTGKNYKSWLTVRDVPSRGKQTRDKGWKTGRVHHLFSDLEASYFYLLEWNDMVIDIREQYPLLDRVKAMRIANELGIHYPIDRNTKTPLVMTTDFLISVIHQGKEIQLARTIKPSCELNKPRVIAKFEIERLYWSSMGVNWKIVTEKNISMIVAKNVDWIHTAYQLQSKSELGLVEIRAAARELQDIIGRSQETVRSILKSNDKINDFQAGTSLYLLRHLLATKQISADMTKSILLNQPANQVLNVTKNNNIGEMRA